MRGTQPKEHDFQQHRWGHGISSISDDDVAIGHGRGIESEDLILLEMTSGRVGVWRVIEIKYWRDPSDMFKAKIEFERYKEG